MATHEEFIPVIEETGLRKVFLNKAVRIKDLKSGDVFFSGADQSTPLTVIAHSKTCKTVSYKAKNGFTSILRANTQVWIIEQ